jgi:predicted MarR family transcription regulator
VKSKGTVIYQMVDFEFNSQLYPYLKEMIMNLPNAPKLVMQALSKKDYNKEDLSLRSGVRRGELNFALCWIEALGFVYYTTSGRQKLYSLTPLGKKVYEEFNDLFHTLKEEPKD